MKKPNQMKNIYYRLKLIVSVLILSMSLSSSLNAQAPTISSFTPANGPVGTPVTITGTNLSSLTSVTIDGVAAIPISNTGTELVAMVMTGTVTGIISVTTPSGSANSISNFTIATSTGPTTQQGTKLVGTGNTGAAWQGGSVSVSADGNTAIIGGFNDNTNTGAAWIYTRTAGTWTQQGAKLVGTGNTGAAYQGSSVSLSADGNTAIVGGYNDNGGVGAAWIFTRTAGTWTQQGTKLVGTGNAGASNQGYSVSLSADGNTAIIGGYNDNGSIGASWIFTRTAGIWSQQGAKLVGTGYSGAARQSQAVSLSADGNTFISGAYLDNGQIGATWIFTRSAGIWSQQGAKLVGTGNIGASRQGQAVSISADGNTAIIGGPNDNGGMGASWIFTRTAGIWTQQGAKLLGTGNIGGPRYGYSVSLSADGNTATIGGDADNNLGASWIFTRSAGTWTQQGSKLVGTGMIGNPHQGITSSLSADGNTLITGGYQDNSNAGATWIFSGTLTVLPVNLLTFSGRNNGTDNLLQWSTTAEQNSAYFDIERSVDGINFSKVGNVASVGNSTSNHFYTYIDNIKGISSQVFYYRLRMVDMDDKFTYSHIIVLNNQKNAIVSVYPNPVSGKAVLQFSDNTLINTSATLSDISGRLVNSFQIKNNFEMIDMGRLPAGTYLLQLANGHVQKIVKE